MHCFMCCSSIRGGDGSEAVPASFSSRRKAPKLEVFLEYLLDSSRERRRVLLQEEIIQRYHSNLSPLESPDGDGGVVQFCSDCGRLIGLVVKLHQELEVIQMKIAEAVRNAKSTIRNATPPSAASGDDQGSSERCEMLSREFQTVITESDASASLCIPLVYLNRISYIPDQHLLPSISSPSSPLGAVCRDVKAEPFDNDSVDIDAGDADDVDIDSNWDMIKPEPSPRPKHLDSRTKRKGRKKLPSTTISSSLDKYRKSRKREASVPKVRLKRAKRSPRTKKVKEPRASSMDIRLEILRKLRAASKGRSSQREGEGKLKASRSGIFKCEQCSFTTTTLTYALEPHLRMVHERPSEINFTCTECSLGFTTQQYYEMHMVRHGTKWKCDVCAENVSAVEMRRHLEGHGGDHVYDCAYCDRLNGTLSGWVNHMRLHPRAKVFCPLCPPAGEGGSMEEFKAYIKFPQHLYEKHGLEEFGYKCEHPGCSRTFFGSTALLRHQNSHSETLQCEHCGGNFLGEKGLRIHTATAHLNKEYACPECGAGFKYHRTLKTHRARVHGVKLWIECELCGDGESGGRKSTFLDKQSYQQHLWTQHRIGEPREFTCSQCPKVFSLKGHLKIHEETHALTKEYKCEICGFETKTRRMLGRHNLRYHIRPGEKNHICSHCGRAFSTKHILDDHVRTHTGERPFVCHVCGSAFAQSSALNTHRKKVHRCT